MFKPFDLRSSTSLMHVVARRCEMWSKRHSARSMWRKHHAAGSLPGLSCLLLVVWAASCLPLATSFAQSQPDPAADQPSDQNAADRLAIASLDAPLVDWAHAVRVYRLIESDIRWASENMTVQTLTLKDGTTQDAITLPPMDEDRLSDEPVIVQGVHALRVTLRWSGREMGSADRTPDDLPAAPGAPVDIARAGREAGASALQRLVVELAEHNASANQVRFILTRIGIDLQVGKSLEPIRLPSSAEQGRVLGTFVPGYHGLRMSIDDPGGDRIATWSWPATNLARNVGPEEQMVRMLTNLKLDRALADIAGKPNGPQLDRFDVIHVVRPDPTQPPTVLIRGNRVLPANAVNVPTLRDMARRMALHLSRRQSETGPMAGTYRPSFDRHQTANASLRDQGIAAYVMSRWLIQMGDDGRARSTSRPRPRIVNPIPMPQGQRPASEEPPVTAAEPEPAPATAANDLPTSDRTDPDVERVRASMLTAVDYITNATLTAANNSAIDESPTAIACAILAMSSHPSLAKRRAERDGLGQILRLHQRGAGAFYAIQGEERRRLPLQDQCIILLSLLRLHEVSGDPDTLAAARRLDAFVLKEGAPVDRFAGPWYQLALETKHRLKLTAGHDADAAKIELALPAAFATGSQTLLSRQILEVPNDAPADLVGGFDLRRRQPGAMPDADRHVAEDLLFLSLTLRNPEAMADLEKVLPRHVVIVRCGQAARFLGQLLVFDPSCYYMRSKESALGGIRESLWNNEQSIEGTALSLLAAIEFEQTLKLPF